MFHIINDSSVIIKSGGVYKQVPVFTHDRQIFAKNGSGFIKLFRHLNGTSSPKISWEDLRLPFVVTYNNVGTLMMPENVDNVVSIAA